MDSQTESEAIRCISIDPSFCRHILCPKGIFLAETLESDRLTFSLQDHDFRYADAMFFTEIENDQKKKQFLFAQTARPDITDNKAISH